MSYVWYMFPTMLLGIPVCIYWINVLKIKSSSKHQLLKWVLIMCCFACTIADIALSKSRVKSQLSWRKSCSEVVQQILKAYDEAHPIVCIDQYSCDAINFAVNCRLKKKENIAQNIKNADEIPYNALVFALDSKAVASTLSSRGFSQSKKTNVSQFFWLRNIKN